MTNTVAISCVIDNSDPAIPLGVEAWIDDKKFFDTDHVSCAKTISEDILDAEGEHILKFVLKNKLQEHTQVDQAGNIISDACISIADVTVDGMMLGDLFTTLADYTHNFNGNGNTIQEKFHGQMGCNGVVSLKFSTPVYMWLLEHM